MRGPRHRAFDAFRAFPPIYVRLLARCGAGRGVRALSREEIAIFGDLPLSRVIAISRLLSFDTVTIGEAERFCCGCRFDPTNSADVKRITDYIRICQKRSTELTPHYLRNSPQWETEFLPLIQRLRSHPTSFTASSPSPSREAKYAT